MLNCTLAFFLTLMMVPLYRKCALKYLILDTPNERSMHALPIPRGAGLTFVVITLLFMGLLIVQGTFDWILPLALSSAVVALAGFLDDLKGLTAKTRFLLHFIASLTLYLWTLHPLLSFQVGSWNLSLEALGSALGPAFAMLLCTTGLVWSVNLYNFMDGINGIATIQGLFYFTVGGFMAWIHGSPELASVAFLFSASLLGFLGWNFPRAKVFMGDIGSGFLGLATGFLALVSEKQYGLPALLWFMLQGVFIFDTTVTLLRRIYHGEKWYSAHRSHAYQRLTVYLHQNHSKVVFLLCLVNVFISGLVILAFFQRHLLPVLFLLEVGLLTFLYLWIEKKNPMTISPKGL